MLLLFFLNNRSYSQVLMGRDSLPIGHKYLEKGYQLINNKDYIGAIAQLNKGIAINPNFSEFYHYRGRAKDLLLDFRGALGDYNLTLTLDPNSIGEVFFERGQIKLSLKDFTGALLDFNKALKLNDKDPRFYLGRGAAKWNLGQKDAGCLDFSKAGELGSSDAYGMIKQFCH